MEFISSILSSLSPTTIAMIVTVIGFVVTMGVSLIFLSGVGSAIVASVISAVLFVGVYGNLGGFDNTEMFGDPNKPKVASIEQCQAEFSKVRKQIADKKNNGEIDGVQWSNAIDVAQDKLRTCRDKAEAAQQAAQAKQSPQDYSVKFKNGY